MAGDVNVLLGVQQYLQLADETEWGTVPGSPTWIDFPVTDYNVRFKPKRKNGQSRIGKFQHNFGTNQSGHPAGTLVTPLFGNVVSSKSLAQRLMEWGFTDQETKFPISKCSKWQYTDHADDKAHTGLRVNSITLAGAEGGITLTLDLIGKTTDNFTGSGSPPTNRNKLVQFLFEDSTVSLAGTEIPVQSWQWQVQRNLDVIYDNSHSPISLPKTDWMETFSVTPLKQDAAWDELRDTLGMQECTGNLTIKGLHNGTGTGGTSWTQCSVAFARLSLVDADQNGGEKVQYQPLSFEVLRPDTSTNGSVMTWTQET